jgi:hypothetical protein
MTITEYEYAATTVRAFEPSQIVERRNKRRPRRQTELCRALGPRGWGSSDGKCWQCNRSVAAAGERGHDLLVCKPRPVACDDLATRYV